MRELTVEADIKKLDIVHNFIQESIKGYECGPAIQFQLEMAVEEIYVNIAYYAYPNAIGITTLKTDVVEDEKGPLLVIDILDQGNPYNPLEHEDPDIELGLEDREAGGLGIYMVKNSMDALSYRYEGKHNIFTVKKYLCN